MFVKTMLPEGLILRPATSDDLENIETIYDVVREYETRHYGEVEATLEDIRRGWTGPNIDLAEDTRLAFDENGRLLGYLRIEHVQHAKFYFALRIRPGYTDRALGAYLLELAELWASERMVKAEPGARVTLNGWLPGNDEVSRRVYEGAGLQEIRRFWEMQIQMHEAPAEPVWPRGIELRPFVPERDGHLAFNMVETAFADHWGHTPHLFEEFQHWTMERSNFDPSLWFLAYEGEQVVGGALCMDETTHGWVDDLAVLRPARGRGLGTALLLHAFGAFYRRGQHTVGLGVDSQNLTGALRIYQRAGMQRVKENINYEKELRAGVELSTRELRD